MVLCKSCTLKQVSYIATGTLHAGMGFHQTKALLVTLNIPGICEKTLNKREREVEQSVEKIADELCNEALEMEASLMDK